MKIIDFKNLKGVDFADILEAARTLNTTVIHSFEIVSKEDDYEGNYNAVLNIQLSPSLRLEHLEVTLVRDLIDCLDHYANNFSNYNEMKLARKWVKQISRKLTRTILRNILYFYDASSFGSTKAKLVEICKITGIGWFRKGDASISFSNESLEHWEPKYPKRLKQECVPPEMLDNLFEIQSYFRDLSMNHHDERAADLLQKLDSALDVLEGRR